MQSICQGLIPRNHTDPVRLTKESTVLKQKQSGSLTEKCCKRKLGVQDEKQMNSNIIAEFPSAYRALLLR